MVKPFRTPSAEPASADGALIQRTLFAGPASWVTEDLYSKVLRGAALRARASVELRAGAAVHTNAYFGRFEASYWQRWTDVREVQVSVAVHGAAHGSIRLRASDIAGHERTVDTVNTLGSGVCTMTVSLGSFLDGGALWLELRALDGTLGFSDIRWSTPDPQPADADGRGTGLAVAICTFNRADDCAETVAALAADALVRGLIDAVYVTDQGADPVDGRERFQDAAALFGEKLHSIRQPNLGGAGGFSRGIYEANSPGACRMDVLLMDDDVRVEPETVLRLAALNRFARTPVLLGAQMLYLYNPDYLLASAERADLDKLAAGLPADEFALADESVLENVQERRIDAGYNGWWTCLIPAAVVERVGLPLPVFFQRDDVEYAYRSSAAGIPSVTVPGAAIWHADFYWKDHDDFALYFGERNGLISSALHGRFDPRSLSKTLARRVASSIVSMRYGEAKTYLMAVQDFLVGPTVLADGGIEALTRARSERAGYAETAMIPGDEMPPGIPIRRAVGRVEEDKADLVLAKRAAKQISGRVGRGPVAIPYEDSFWWHVSLFDEAYVTDASQQGVRHVRRDTTLAKSLTKQAAVLLRRFRVEGPQAAAAYRAAMPELTGRENWARLFGI